MFEDYYNYVTLLVYVGGGLVSIWVSYRIIVRIKKYRNKEPVILEPVKIFIPTYDD
jgi:hypothetical protein